ncbi:MAG: hypothetical protein GF344_12790 [Chitinivibrionales bacterium]|nr:hypothetical protein [Chitinivibrionales bacterium]MBD3357620.1 hypothetical protein [Chitinivibrionales bacterium]
MTIAEMVKMHRERVGVSPEELAKRIKIPVSIVTLIENPEKRDEEAIKLFASVLNVPIDVFTGERPAEPTEQEKQAAAESAAAAEMAELARTAKYPHVRRFILDPSRCRNADKAKELLAERQFSLPERNVILYLLTSALYHFCDTNTSSFAFDAYLFGLHDTLIARFEKQLDSQGVTGEAREERMDAARSNIFACEAMADIAILVLDAFAVEFERKLEDGVEDFAEDLDLPLDWELDDQMMRIIFYGHEGTVKDTIKLLDVKERQG